MMGPCLDTIFAPVTSNHMGCEEIETKTAKNQLLEEECDELKWEVEAAQAHLAHAKKGEAKMPETAKKLYLTCIEAFFSLLAIVCHFRHLPSRKEMLRVFFCVVSDSNMTCLCEF